MRVQLCCVSFTLLSRFRVDEGMEKRADVNDDSSFSSDSSLSHKKLSSNSFRRQDDALKSPQPVDFGLWKLAPPVLGLFAIGVYAGYKKQVQKSNAIVVGRTGMDRFSVMQCLLRDFSLFIIMLDFSLGDRRAGFGGF